MHQNHLLEQLKLAYSKRDLAQPSAILAATRIFHGPSEGSKNFAIEIFKDKTNSYAWVFEKEAQEGLRRHEDLATIVDFLKSIGVSGAVHLYRPFKSSHRSLAEQVPEDAQLLFGTCPEACWVSEEGGEYEIHFEKTKHPGLFLDHQPLRQWLKQHAKDKTVLNTFAYTGSLSIASLAGGASHVTTVDLSKATIDWAKRNWAHNLERLGSTCGSDFWAQDIFEWFPRTIKKQRRFNIVITDPPSFSRSKQKVFSTAKDLFELHDLAIACVEKNGILITSINSDQMTKKQYWREVESALKQQKREAKVIREISAPEHSFPQATYLKGWIIQLD